MSHRNNSIIYDLLPVILFGLSIPLSIFMLLGNLGFSKINWGSETNVEGTAIPLTRWFFSTLGSTLFMVYGIKRKALSKSGALLSIVVSFVLSIANHAFFVSLIVFFVSSSRATKFRANMKRRFESDFKEGEGQRNWIQVLCNGGMAAQLALLYHSLRTIYSSETPWLYLINCGSGERPINFGEHYRSAWLSIGVMSALACCNGDTWASELGTVLSSSDPYLITTLRRVPRGTNGGVSIIGIFVSFVGGTVIGLGYYLTVIYTVDAPQLQVSPAQWPLIFYGGIAGLFGSLIDSFLGATLQYSGIDRSGKVVEQRSDNVKYISGWRILDNHSVNLISSIATGVLIPVIALKTWPQRY